MNRIPIKILIWTISIVAVGIISYFVYVIMTFDIGYGGECGMDDGPFKGIIIDPIEKSVFAQVFEIENGQLILENRNDSLSPILMLIENGITKWTIDTDVRNTFGNENSRIWEISDVSITNKSNPIELEFIGHWTYGAEFGSMTIERNNGDNKFCLSW